MRSRLLWRRSATTLGVYLSTVLGFLSTVVATRELGRHDYGRFVAVFAAMTFVQSFLDLTVDETIVKYGFRYAETERWGRLRRLFRAALLVKLAGGVAAAVVTLALAPLVPHIWGASGVLVPMLVAAAVPIVQAPENVAASALMLRGRYDLRAAFLAVSMGLRLAGLAIGATYGVTGALLGLAAGQAIASGVVGAVGAAAFRRFPAAAEEPLADDARDVRWFVARSSVYTSLISARGTLATALLPTVTHIDQAAYFRNAQAPATALAAISSPARLVLLAEQTRDFEAGRADLVYRMLRRYVAGTTALMAVVVPLGWWLMPWALGLAYGAAYREHATTAARVVLLTAALQFVWGWTKSFPVSIGRPGLRILAHGVEVAVFVPLLFALAPRWGASGAAAAMLASTVVFCAVWVVLLLRLRPAIPLPASA